MINIEIEVQGLMVQTACFAFPKYVAVIAALSVWRRLLQA
jgi:hypothetical protein